MPPNTVNESILWKVRSDKRVIWVVADDFDTALSVVRGEFAQDEIVECVFVREVVGNPSAFTGP